MGDSIFVDFNDESVNARKRLDVLIKTNSCSDGNVSLFSSEHEFVSFKLKVNLKKDVLLFCTRYQFY